MYHVLAPLNFNFRQSEVLVSCSQTAIHASSCIFYMSAEKGQVQLLYTFCLAIPKIWESLIGGRLVLTVTKFSITKLGYRLKQ